MHKVLDRVRAIDMNHKYVLAVVDTEEFASLLERKLQKPWWKKLVTGNVSILWLFQQ